MDCVSWDCLFGLCIWPVVIHVEKVHVCNVWSCWVLQETGIFPDTDTDWKAFLEVQRLVLKNTGRLYAPPSLMLASIVAGVSCTG